MARINILQSSVYNKIAAGEVIERPASVVKELLDNSIDAQSSDIKISVRGGGLKSIFLKDNGCGIDKDDLPAAFLPHATSKIKDENDLYDIKTLGFRGEALASIAAVSMVEIKSITQGETEGALLKISGGEVSEQNVCALSGGTQITVENLFYNTPVRLKFLKSERAEEAEIVNLVSRYILCNPNIRISLEVNGAEVFQSNGGGLQDALCCVYGAEILKNLIKIEAKKGDMSLDGFIGKPSFAKPNRTYQTVALNNRLISNATISAAAANAYGDYLVKRQYPFYVLHLCLPPSLVDVNVHPNKMDVRFEDSGKVYSLFHNTVAAALHKDMQAEVLCNVQENDVAENHKSYTQCIVEMYNTSHNILNFDDLRVKDIEKPQENPQYINKDCLNNTIVDDNKTDKPTIKVEEKPASADAQYYNIAGTLFDTYIVLQINEDALIIDQHAAHERLLYDKFCRQYFNKEIAVQYLLAPYLISVNALEFEFIQNNLDVLRQSGFNIEVFGERVFKLSALPVLLSDMDIDKFFADILCGAESGKQTSGDSLIRERFMKKACCAAVKAGDVLSKADIDEIVKRLFEGGELHCPHGRPIVLRYNKKEIDKLFKRVL